MIKRAYVLSVRLSLNVHIWSDTAADAGALHVSFYSSSPLGSDKIVHTAEVKRAGRECNLSTYYSSVDSFPFYLLLHTRIVT